MLKKSDFKKDASKALREVLREKRLALQLKQSDLAERLETYPSFVSKYESGERRLDVLELRKVCLALNVTIPKILREIDKRIGKNGAS